MLKPNIKKRKPLYEPTKLINGLEPIFQKYLRTNDAVRRNNIELGRESNPDNVKYYDMRREWMSGGQGATGADGKVHFGSVGKQPTHPTAWKGYYAEEFGENPDEVEVDLNKKRQSQDRVAYELTRDYADHAKKSRSGVRPNYDENNNRTGESSHKMASGTAGRGKNKRYTSYPTLFQNDDGTWVDFERGEGPKGKHPGHEAWERGEEYTFPREEDAKAFGHGAWKKKGPGYKDGGILYRK